MKDNGFLYDVGFKISKGGKMKKEELLGCLDIWFVNTDWSENGYCPPIPDKHKRAYREIVAILKKSGNE